MLNYSIDIVNYFTDNSTRYTKTHKRDFFVSYNDNVKLNDKIKDIKIILIRSSFISNYDKTVSKNDKRYTFSIIVYKASSLRRHSIVVADEVTYDQDLESYIQATMISPLISTLHILMQLALPFDVSQDTSQGIEN